MDSYQKKKINLLFGLVVFLIAMALQVIGQQMVASKVGLMIQLLSLGLLLGLLYLYNRKYR